MSNRYEPVTSPSLILRIRDADDSGSWEIFATIYSPVVRTYCRRRGIQEADIDDLVQDVMTTLTRAIRSFEYDPARGRFRAWFGTVTANRVNSWFSQRSLRAKEVSLEEVGGNEHFVGSDSDSLWDSVFCQQVLNAACQRIRLRVESITWSSFELTWLHNIPAAEAAAKLAIPVHTVYVNKSRVLKLLEAEVRLLADEFPVMDSGDTRLSSSDANS